MTAASHLGNHTPPLQMSWLSTYAGTKSSFSVKFHIQGMLQRYCYPLLPASTNLQHHLFAGEREFLFLYHDHKCKLMPFVAAQVCHLAEQDLAVAVASFPDPLLQLPH